VVPGLAFDPKRFAVGAEKPFTLALWVRGPAAPVAGVNRFVQAETVGTDPPRGLSIWGIRDTVRCELRDGTETITFTAPLDELGSWTHVALVRDPKNVLRFYVNGRTREEPRWITYPAALDYAKWGLAVPWSGRMPLEFDEICLFDRALSADELERLARPDKRDAVPVAVSAEPAPAPRERIIPILPPPAPAAATEFKGLKFYLDGDTLDDGQVIDAVSKKVIGKPARVELVPGPRGKALRLTAQRDKNAEDSAALKIDPALLKIPANKPFTLALWVRCDAVGPKPKAKLRHAHMVFSALSRTKVQNGTEVVNRTLWFQVDHGSVQYSWWEGDERDRTGGRPVQDSTTWRHYALVRTERNEMHKLLDGEGWNPKDPQVFRGALDYQEFRLVTTSSGSYTVEIDEFCLFDRALSPEEVNRLAGREKK
jgi:hypothetical protein